jgi:ribosome-associated translation inhibitor RaiA
MFIDTRAIGFSLTEPIVRHVEARFESALGPFARWILKVTVRLDDVNADRGGIDKRCAVVVAMRRHGVAVAEAVDEDLYRAVDEAASRARKSVARDAKRHIARGRRDPQRPGALVSL